MTALSALKKSALLKRAFNLIDFALYLGLVVLIALGALALANGLRGRTADQVAQSHLQAALAASNSIASSSDLLVETDGVTVAKASDYNDEEKGIAFQDSGTVTGRKTVGILAGGTTQVVTFYAPGSNRCWVIQNDLANGVSYGVGPGTGNSCTAAQATAVTVSSTGGFPNR